MTRKMLLAAPALALGALSMAAVPASAHEADTWSTQTALAALNGSGVTGSAMVDLHGSEATVSIDVSGAADAFVDGPFPHAQHVHIGAQGVCPTAEADTDGDGVVSTPEGQPLYGTIGASLTTEGDTSADSALAVERFPGGSSYTYERTFEVDAGTAASIRDGAAVVVVHGVDPSLLPAAAAEEMSPLDPGLPLAATLPAACGTLTATQVGAVPDGAADAGVTPEAGTTGNAAAVAVAGLGVLAVAGSAVLARRRTTHA